MFFQTSILWNLLGIVTALFAVVYTYFKWSYQYWKKKNVPQISPTIPFGNLTNPLTEHVAESIDEIYKKARDRGWKYCGLYMLVSPNLLVLDLEMIKNILTRDFQYFMDRGIYANEKDELLSHSLYCLAGSRWKKLRAKLTLSFSSDKLKAMFQTLMDCGLVLECYIEEKTKPEDPVDIKELLACFSTDVIGSCAFGLDCNSFEEPNSVFRRFGNRILAITPLNVVKSMFCQNFPELARVLGIRQVSRDITDFFSGMVKETVSYREKHKIVRRDFLQLLLDIRNTKERQKNVHRVPDDGNSLTMDEMIAQCILFFISSYETSSATMSFALFELAMHPDIQEKLRDEINTVLANHEDEVTYYSLSEMKYLGQVVDDHDFKETLRIHPPTSTIIRYCNSDYNVPGEDLVIEKGTKLVISVKSIQNDEEYWKNPKEFDPERFSDERKKNMHQCAYLPFGQGPRMCIGEKFGLMQVKVGLTCLLRNFRVKLNKKTTLPLETSAKNKVNSAVGGIWLNLERV